MGVDKVDITAGCIIRKPAQFLQQDTSTLVHLLGSSDPGDHGKAAPKLVQQKWVLVRSPSPVESDDSNPISLGHHLDDTDQSQPTPCNSCDSSPVPAGQGIPDDNLIELEASQDDLDELDEDESTDFLLETSQDSQILKCQLHDKGKQVKKAEKQARIQQQCSQLAETDHQLDLLKQNSLAQSTANKSSRQPAATSAPQNAGQADQSWLQQANLEVADAFLNQLGDTPAKGAGDSQHITDKPSKATKKRKPAQLWFLMPEQKWQHLDDSKVSSKQSSDEPLSESSVTSSLESDSSAKNTRWHKRSKKCKLKLEMFAKHTSTIKSHNCDPITIWTPISFLTCPSFRISPGTNWWLER